MSGLDTAGIVNAQVGDHFAKIAELSAAMLPGFDVKALGLFDNLPGTSAYMQTVIDALPTPDTYVTGILDSIPTPASYVTSVFDNLPPIGMNLEPIGAALEAIGPAFVFADSMKWLDRIGTDTAFFQSLVESVESASMTFDLARAMPEMVPAFDYVMGTATEFPGLELDEEQRRVELGPLDWALLLVIFPIMLELVTGKYTPLELTRTSMLTVALWASVQLVRDTRAKRNLPR